VRRSGSRLRQVDDVRPVSTTAKPSAIRPSSTHLIPRSDGRGGSDSRDPPVGRVSGRGAVARGAYSAQAPAFKLSNDPLFTEKVFDVVGVYLNPPEGAVVLSVDEKSQVQALARSVASRPSR
jgi:hypothetical protein